MFSPYKFFKIIFCSLLLVSVFNVNAENQSSAQRNVMEWMTLVIVPQSTILWNVDNPESDEDWQELLLAAEKIITAAKALGKSALSRDGSDWSTQSEWHIFINQMKTAAGLAQEAIMQKNLDKLFDAGDELYPPCEACHLRFNPAVVQNQ